MIHNINSTSSEEKRRISTIIKSFQPEDINEVYMLLEDVTQKPKEYILANSNMIISPDQFKKLSQYIERLRKNEPLAHILSFKHFFDSKFLVDKHTLIPRPETELLVEKVLRKISKEQGNSLDILEIGTGSGCIAISLLKEITQNSDFDLDIKLTATDISPKTLEIAKKNSKQILPKEAQTHISFIQADILPKKLNKRFDIIISNPPYITSEEYKNLDKSVKDYEPKIALEGGIKGLDVFEKILDKTKKNTKQTTAFFFEINPAIRYNLKRLIKKYYPNSKPKFTKDQYATYRFVEFFT